MLMTSIQSTSFTQDMLPMEMQRLVKYPMLLEAIAKYTSEPSIEFDRVIDAFQQAKELLKEVNKAKTHSENLRR